MSWVNNTDIIWNLTLLDQRGNGRGKTGSRTQSTQPFSMQVLKHRTRNLITVAIFSAWNALKEEFIHSYNAHLRGGVSEEKDLIL